MKTSTHHKPALPDAILRMSALNDENSQPVDLSDTQIRQQIANLLGVIDQFLGMMPELGQCKKILGEPVYDAGQEQRLLDKALNISEQLELSSSLVLSFAQGQIEAARTIQSRANRDQLPQVSKNVAGSQRKTLERDAGQLLRPMLEALQPLADSLNYGPVQTEIGRQLMINEAIDPVISSQVFYSLKPPCLH